ncbi:hypothetical protein H5J22_07840 [Cetobacterium sp. 8H]|uniref:hypothetical protein n=1 Tax=Cetobacterium sp. 8H TaxID=2759681 RepID=UPI00163C21E1|nr:hypothetical protein [Cetobacterium sp. 8H]MBC2851315.1 hypothetical protein [Cetobacterium sp. 8H]
MKKIAMGLLIFILSIPSLASSGVGIVKDEDFRAVGVSQENIDKVKTIITEASTQYKLKTLDKKALEIEINKYILDGTEKNLDKLNELVEKVGIVDAEIIKDRLKYQIEVQKYISTDQYLKARELSLEKLTKTQQKQ